MTTNRVGYRTNDKPEAFFNAGRFVAGCPHNR